MGLNGQMNGPARRSKLVSLMAGTGLTCVALAKAEEVWSRPFAALAVCEAIVGPQPDTAASQASASRGSAVVERWPGGALVLNTLRLDKTAAC